MRTLALAIFSTILLGCASEVYISPSNGRSNEAKVYVIRQRAEPTMWSLYVNLDKIKIASLANSSYVEFGVVAGDHRLLLDWPLLATSPKVEAPVKLVAGKTYYFEVSSTINTSGIGGGAISTNHSIALYRLDDKAGEALIRRMKIKPA